MTNEEKILELLTLMQQDISVLKGDVSGLKSDVSSLKDGQAKLEADVSGIKVRLDIEIQKQLDQLADGQDQLHRKITRVESLAEETRDTVDVIHAVVSQHSRDIIELKKVQ